MFNSLDISTSALLAQRTRMDAISGNIANLSTTRNEAGESIPYQPRFVVFKTDDQVKTVDGAMGVRVDSVAYEQYRVLPFYDSMVAKVIVTADSRPAAIMRMRRALQEYVVEGIKTNIPFHRRLLSFDPFVQGRYDTRAVERLLAEQGG